LLTSKFTRRSLFGVALVTLSSPTFAHALPGTVITFKKTETGIAIKLEVNLVELLLALSEGLPKDGATLMASHQLDLQAYFDAHVGLSAYGHEIPMNFQTMSLGKANNDHVGDYEVLQLGYVASITRPTELTLTYDAVIHQVVTHAAEVRVVRGGILPETIGVIRYSQKKKKILPLVIPPFE
jgi:hypothetical protein